MLVRNHLLHSHFDYTILKYNHFVEYLKKNNFEVHCGWAPGLKLWADPTPRDESWDHLIPKYQEWKAKNARN